MEENKKKEINILVLLYGDFDYDGRVQRVCTVLSEFGNVVVLDAANVKIRRNHGLLRRLRVLQEPNWSLLRKHTTFLRASIYWARHLKPTLIAAEDYFTVFSGLIAASTCGARLVYDAHELIIPEAGNRDIRNYIWYLLEKIAIKQVDGVIAANSFRANKMKNHYELLETPIVFLNIPQIPKTALSHEATHCIQSSSADEIRLIYQGAMQWSRGLGRFVETLPYLPSNMKLVMVGDGPDLKRIRNYANNFNLNDRVIFLGKIPNEALPSVTRHCHIGIVAYSYDDLNNIYCSPNKIFEYAQANLPVVATDQPPLQEYINKYGIGKVIHQNDGIEVMAQTIRDVADNANKYKDGIPKFLNNHRWEDEFERLKHAYQLFLSSKARV